jgi:hypothetical protein
LPRSGLIWNCVCAVSADANLPPPRVLVRAPLWHSGGLFSPPAPLDRSAGCIRMRFSFACLRITVWSRCWVRAFAVYFSPFVAFSFLRCLFSVCHMPAGYACRFWAVGLHGGGG